MMKSITIRAQFVVEELYSGYNTYNNKSYLPIRKGNAIHDMGLTSVRGRRTEVAYRMIERINSMFPATRQELNDYMIGS